MPRWSPGRDPDSDEVKALAAQAARTSEEGKSPFSVIDFGVINFLAGGRPAFVDSALPQGRSTMTKHVIRGLGLAALFMAGERARGRRRRPGQPAERRRLLHQRRQHLEGEGLHEGARGRQVQRPRRRAAAHRVLPGRPPGKLHRPGQPHRRRAGEPAAERRRSRRSPRCRRACRRRSRRPRS